MMRAWGWCSHDRMRKHNVDSVECCQFMIIFSDIQPVLPPSCRALFYSRASFLHPWLDACLDHFSWPHFFHPPTFYLLPRPIISLPFALPPQPSQSSPFCYFSSCISEFTSDAEYKRHNRLYYYILSYSWFLTGISLVWHFVISRSVVGKMLSKYVRTILFRDRAVDGIDRRLHSSPS